jgi:hypothetical protein
VSAFADRAASIAELERRMAELHNGTDLTELRDRFAMAALSGAAVIDLRRYGTDAAPNLDVCAKYAERAYAYADAMLVAREPKDPTDRAPTLDHGQSPDQGEGQ